MAETLPQLAGYSKEFIYAIVWESHPEAFFRGLASTIQRDFDQPLGEVRKSLTDIIENSNGLLNELDINLSSKSWYAVSEDRPEIIKKNDRRATGNTRFILISLETTFRPHKNAGPILCERLFKSYFPEEEYPFN